MMIRHPVSYLFRIGCLAASLTAALFVAGKAFAAGPVLKAVTVIERDVVTLGDVVDQAGDKAHIPLFRAPAPGETGTIQAPRILAAARELGLEGIDTRGAAQVMISRKGRLASREDIETALANAIGDRLKLSGLNIGVTFDGPLPSLTAATQGRSEVIVSEFAVDDRSKRFVGTISMLNAGSRGAAVKVSGAFVETMPVAILNRPMQRGDVLRIDDVTFERREKEAVGGDAPSSADLVIGRALRRPMKAGMALRDTDLFRPVAVERGATITVTYEAPGMSLSLKAKALESGAQGDAITIQNLGSKRTVQATVTGPNSVRVAPGSIAQAPTRTATAERSAP